MTSPILRILVFRILPYLLLALLIIGIERNMNRLYTPVIAPPGNLPVRLFIPTGASLEQVVDSLSATPGIREMNVILNVMKLKHYDRHIKPGSYLLQPGMNAFQLTDKLIRGLQNPVRVRFHGVRKPEELAGQVSHQIEADSLSLIRMMQDQRFLDSLGLTPSSLFTITLPNTYEMWWNTSARGFLVRMATEAAAFWNETRLEQAREARLTRQEVVILASIIEKETAKNDEKATIAGVYINRLRKGWPLQADPTLIFAWNDFTIKRVLNHHKTIDSPYNTYQKTGLPPGPICLPSIASIDAVLGYQSHDFFYFCAREDFSGYHRFAVTLAEHNRNALKYRNALNASSNP